MLPFFQIGRHSRQSIALERDNPVSVMLGCKGIALGLVGRQHNPIYDWQENLDMHERDEEYLANIDRFAEDVLQ